MTMFLATSQYMIEKFWIHDEKKPVKNNLVFELRCANYMHCSRTSCICMAERVTIR